MMSKMPDANNKPVNWKRDQSALIVSVGNLIHAQFANSAEPLHSLMRSVQKGTKESCTTEHRKAQSRTIKPEYMLLV